MKITLNNSTFSQVKFENELELEKAVVVNSEEIFGKKSVYFDIKKKIKNGNGFANIPDGYVLDFRDDCKLWVVENELSHHDSFKHVGIQLLQFATQFSSGSYEIKELLVNALNADSVSKDKVEKLLAHSNFKNIGDALDFAIFRNEFGFVVVIDEITEDLQNVTRELARQPELIIFEKYVLGDQTLHRFDELLKELDDATSTKVKEVSDIDTIVCPARPEGFNNVFLGEKVWHAVRISPSIIPKLRYIAIYQVSPVSAIQWVGKISSIKPYQNTGKYIVYTSEIFKVGPIKMDSQKFVPQGSRYTQFSLIENATKLSDIF
jgi:hypothetical protein